MAERQKHNALELTAAFFCTENVHQRKVGHECAYQSGQSGHPSTYQQDGWSPVQGLITITTEYCRGSEYRSRLPIEGIPRQQQLETETLGGGPNREHFETVLCGSVHGPSEHAKTGLCELETRPTCNDGRCIQPVMEQSETICVSTILPDREVPGEDSKGSGHIGVDNTDMADTNVIPEIIRNGSGGSNISPADDQSPTHRNKTDVEGLRYSLIARRLSDDSSALFLVTETQDTIRL